jgi:hypothetical protein
VYEVDGGEWLDFVSSDLKHLSPRPARGGAPAAMAEPEPEPAAEEAPSAAIIVHPAAEPAPEPAMAAAAETAAADEAQEAPPRYDAASLT